MRIESERMKRRQADAHFKGKEMNEYNQHFKVLEQEELRIQREHDKILLDYALMKERESDYADNMKKNEIRKSAKQYAEYLKEQAIRESDESAYLDEIHRKEEEKIMQLKDNDLKQRNDARNNLMKMVDNGRQEQIRYKNDSIMRERIENRNFDMKFMSDARNAIVVEKNSEMNRRNFNIENNQKLADQILYRREKEEKEKQDIYLADKRMKFIERTQQQKLAEQGGAIRTNFPLKHCDWN